MILGGLLGVFGVLVLRSRRKLAIATLILGLLIPVTAIAGVPFIFANGTIADASQINADFAALTPIQGKSTVTDIMVSGDPFVFASTPSVTAAPRNLTCLVTVEANGVAGFSAQPIQMKTAIKVGSTQTAGPENNLFFSFGPNVSGDNNYFGTYTQVYTVNAGSSVTFGAYIVPSTNFQVNVTAVYNCI
jgi:hypothetical protein